jgi:hypothetical protein
MPSDRSPFKTSILPGFHVPATSPGSGNTGRFHVDEVALLAQDHFTTRGNMHARKPNAGFESRARYLGAV